jgi:hypothetical protein
MHTCAIVPRPLPSFFLLSNALLCRHSIPMPKLRTCPYQIHAYITRHNMPAGTVWEQGLLNRVLVYPWEAIAFPYDASFFLESSLISFSS